MVRDAMSALRLPIVGVMGSGVTADERAAELGRELARLPVHLLTGGGRGAMEAVSRGFFEAKGRRGLVIGVLPADPDDPTRSRPGYPNPWIEIVIRTHLPLSGERGEHSLSRNHINVLTSDVLLALAGGAGTLSEVRLALRYGKPIAALVTGREDLPGLPQEVTTLTTAGEAVAFAARQLGLA